MKTLDSISSQMTDIPKDDDDECLQQNWIQIFKLKSTDIHLRVDLAGDVSHFTQ